MNERAVIIALGVVVACFLFGIVWPLLDDDRVSVMQWAIFGGGLFVAGAGAMLFWRGSR
jgi:hypothetical protein